MDSKKEKEPKSWTRMRSSRLVRTKFSQFRAMKQENSWATLNVPGPVSLLRVSLPVMASLRHEFSEVGPNENETLFLSHNEINSSLVLIVNPLLLLPFFFDLFDTRDWRKKRTDLIVSRLIFYFYLIRS